MSKIVILGSLPLSHNTLLSAYFTIRAADLFHFFIKVDKKS